jgi:hypothetical protein
MSDARVLALVEELNDIVAADGATLRITDSTAATLALELDLTQSECPECVVPKQFIVDIVTARFSETGDPAPAISLFDPREEPGWEPRAH